MSRKMRLSHDHQYRIDFGHDHVVGYFIQIWDLEKDKKGNIKEEPIIDCDDGPFLGGCSSQKVKDTASLYGVTITDLDLQSCQSESPRRDINKLPFSRLLSALIERN